MLQKIKGPFLPVFICFLLLASALTVRLIRYDKLSSLVGFGCIEVVCFSELNRHLLPEDPFVFNTGGYDGQFYYYIAAGWATGEEYTVDSKEFRLSRPGFSVLLSLFGHFGPAAIIAGGLLLLAGTQLLCVYLLYEKRPYLSWMVAVNPVQILSFYLFLADGLAFCFALYGLLVFERLQASSNNSRKIKIFNILFVFVLITAALFTKESSIWAGAGLGLFSLLHKERWPYAAGLLVSLFLFLLLWHSTGLLYSVQQKASFPFSGLIQYLQNADAVTSGRSLLIVYLVFFAVILIVQLSLAVQFIRKNGVAKIPADQLLSAALIAGALFTISFATAHEYWANFANISRMFLPGITGCGFIFYSSEKEKESGLHSTLRKLSFACIAYSLMFSVLMIYSERG